MCVYAVYIYIYIYIYIYLHTHTQTLTNDQVHAGHMHTIQTYIHIMPQKYTSMSPAVRRAKVQSRQSHKPPASRGSNSWRNAIQAWFREYFDFEAFGGAFVNAAAARASVVTDEDRESSFAVSVLCVYVCECVCMVLQAMVTEEDLQHRQQQIMTTIFSIIPF